MLSKASRKPQLGPALLAASLSLAACREKAVEVPVAPAPAPAMQESPPARKTYGQPIAPAGAVPIATLLREPDRHATGPVTVEGVVRRACSRKGCWMELAESADPKAPGCRVTFKDYGFFVPTDAAGARARVQGAVAVTTVKPAMVRHLEEEGAVFASKAADGTAKEVRIVATGVELARATPAAR